MTELTPTPVPAPRVKKPTATERQIAELSSQVAALIAMQAANQPAPPPVTPVATIHDQAASAVIKVVLIGLAIFVGRIEYQRRTGPAQPSHQVDSADVVRADPGASWSALAKWVESGKVASTSELLSIAKQLDLDLTRLQSLVDKPSKITDTNRAEILALIGGAK